MRDIAWLKWILREKIFGPNHDKLMIKVQTWLGDLSNYMSGLLKFFLKVCEFPIPIAASATDPNG